MPLVLHVYHATRTADVRLRGDVSGHHVASAMGEISAWLEQTPGPGRVLFDVRSAKRLAAEERDFAQSAAATAQLRALGAPLRWAYLARPEQTLLLDLTKQLLAVTPGASCDCRTFSEDVEALAWLDGDTPSVSKPSRIEAASEAA